VGYRFYIDPETGEPHLLRHAVTEAEAIEVLARPLEDRTGHDGARVAIGRTSAGRYLRVVYVPDQPPSALFVITAYELPAKAKVALRRRWRRK
jgi:hypothetical protein